MNQNLIAAAVMQAGGVPILLGIARTQVADLTDHLAKARDVKADLLITLAGTSVGDRDLLHYVLTRDGKTYLNGVHMRPGQSVQFGTVYGIPVLGLPGRPGAAMIAFEVMARPVLLKMAGKTKFDRPTMDARLLGQVRNRLGWRSYVWARIEAGQEGYTVRSLKEGMGILSSMAHSNALIVIPEDVAVLEQGSRVSVRLI